MKNTVHTGVVHGYLVVHYKTDGTIVNYDFTESSEVHACVRDGEKEQYHHGFAFYTLIQTKKDIEVEEGFYKRYVRGTKLYRKVCRCLSYTWAPYHSQIQHDVHFTCNTCLGNRSLITRHYG